MEQFVVRCYCMKCTFMEDERFITALEAVEEACRRRTAHNSSVDILYESRIMLTAKKDDKSVELRKPSNRFGVVPKYVWDAYKNLVNAVLIAVETRATA